MEPITDIFNKTTFMGCVIFESELDPDHKQIRTYQTYIKEIITTHYKYNPISQNLLQLSIVNDKLSQISKTYYQAFYHSAFGGKTHYNDSGEEVEQYSLYNRYINDHGESVVNKTDPLPPNICKLMTNYYYHRKGGLYYMHFTIATMGTGAKFIHENNDPNMNHFTHTVFWCLKKKSEYAKSIQTSIYFSKAFLTIRLTQGVSFWRKLSIQSLLQDHREKFFNFHYDFFIKSISIKKSSLYSRPNLSYFFGPSTLNTSRDNVFKDLLKYQQHITDPLMEFLNAEEYDTDSIALDVSNGINNSMIIQFISKNYQKFGFTSSPTINQLNITLCILKKYPDNAWERKLISKIPFWTIDDDDQKIPFGTIDDDETTGPYDERNIFCHWAIQEKVIKSMLQSHGRMKPVTFILVMKLVQKDWIQGKIEIENDTDQEIDEREFQQIHKKIESIIDSLIQSFNEDVWKDFYYWLMVTYIEVIWNNKDDLLIAILSMLKLIDNQLLFYHAESEPLLE